MSLPTTLSPAVRRLAVVGVAAMLLAACSSSDNTASPTATTSTPTTSVASHRCGTTDLTISAVSAKEESAQRTVLLALDNSSDAQCSLTGYASVALFKNVTPVATTVKQDSAAPTASATVELAPRARAFFDLQYSTLASGPETCTAITRISVTPPGDNRELLLPLTNVAIASLCPSAGITLSAVRATETKPSST